MSAALGGSLASQKSEGSWEALLGLWGKTQSSGGRLRAWGGRSLGCQYPVAGFRDAGRQGPRRHLPPQRDPGPSDGETVPRLVEDEFGERESFTRPADFGRTQSLMATGRAGSGPSRASTTPAGAVGTPRTMARYFLVTARVSQSRRRSRAATRVLATRTRSLVSRSRRWTSWGRRRSPGVGGGARSGCCTHRPWWGGRPGRRVVDD